MGCRAAQAAFAALGATASDRCDSAVTATPPAPRRGGAGVQDLNRRAGGSGPAARANREDVHHAKGHRRVTPNPGHSWAGLAIAARTSPRIGAIGVGRRWPSVDRRPG